MQILKNFEANQLKKICFWGFEKAKPGNLAFRSCMGVFGRGGREG